MRISVGGKTEPSSSSQFRLSMLGPDRTLLPLKLSARKADDASGAPLGAVGPEEHILT